MQPEAVNPAFVTFWLRTTACHMVTYFVAGMFAFVLMDYRGFFQTPGLKDLMRPIESTWMAVGPAFQFFRGLVLAAVLYPFRGVFLDSPSGWWRLALLLIGLCVLSPSGPVTGSLEGLFYTRLSLAQHLRGLPEVLVQNAAFAWLLVAWNRQPSPSWDTWMGVGTALVIVLSLKEYARRAASRHREAPARSSE
jgi:hypothetical protein